MKAFMCITDTMADWEVGYLLAELNSKRYFKASMKDLEVIKISNNNDVKTTMGGLQIIPEKTIDEIDFQDNDILILPGGDKWLEKENEVILKRAKEYIERDLKVAAICGATIGLAKCGALDHKIHTSNDKDFLKMICPEYRGEKLYVNKPAVIDKQLITASGIAPLEFTYLILKLIGVFSEETLENWYNLYKTQEAEYFYGLMKSLEQ